MKTKKLGNFKGFGIEGNVFNIMNLFSTFLAGLVMILMFTQSQKAAKKLESMIPGLDGTPNQPFEANKVAQRGKRAY